MTAPLAAAAARSSDGPPDYDDFVRRHGLRLRVLAHRRLGSFEDAEEIAQETLLRAHAQWAAFDDENAAAAWTTVVATRLAVDRLRVRGRWVSVPEVTESARTVRDTAEIVVARAEARSALDALEAVPARQAAVLWAREIEGLSYDQIADRHGLTEPTVRSLLHRGRRALRREYAQRGGTLPLGAVLPIAPVVEALRLLGRSRRTAIGAAGAATTAAAIVAAVVLAPPGPSGSVADLVTAGPALVQSAPVDSSPAPADATADAAVTAPAVVPPPVAPHVTRPERSPAPAPDVLDALPTGCTSETVGEALGVQACGDRPESVPEGGATLSLPLPLPVELYELSSSLLEQCATLTGALCRPSGTAAPSAPPPGATDGLTLDPADLLENLR